MDLDGDGFLDLVTINDGEIAGGNGFSRREHVFANDGKGRFRDMTDAWWPPASNVGEDDNMAAFLDFDSDGDADFVIGSLSGPDRLLVNDGRGHLSLRRDVFGGDDTPGTLGLALADLDGDGRMDVVQGQGEHKTAIDERVFSGRGLAVDTAPPSVTMVAAREIGEGRRRGARARARPQESRACRSSGAVSLSNGRRPRGSERRPMRWYGEYLWRADWPSDVPPSTPYRVCADRRPGEYDLRGRKRGNHGISRPARGGPARPDTTRHRATRLDSAACESRSCSWRLVRRSSSAHRLLAGAARRHHERADGHGDQARVRCALLHRDPHARRRRRLDRARRPGADGGRSREPADAARPRPRPAAVDRGRDVDAGRRRRRLQGGEDAQGGRGGRGERPALRIVHRRAISHYRPGYGRRPPPR